MDAALLARLTPEDIKEQFIDGYLRSLAKAGLAIDDASMNYAFGSAIAEGIAQALNPRVLHIEIKHALGGTE